MDQGAVAQVVQATVLEDLGTGLEPHGLAEVHTVLGQQLRGQAAQSTCREKGRWQMVMQCPSMYMA